MSTTVAPVSGLAGLLPRLGEIAPFSWAFFGRNPLLLAGLRELLGRFPEAAVEIPAGGPVNEAAEELRPFALDLDRHFLIGDRDLDRLFWGSTHFAEKSPISSTFLLDCCAALALRRIRSRTQGNLLALFEDDFLAAYAAGLAGNNGPDGPGGVTDRLRGLREAVRTSLDPLKGRIARIAQLGEHIRARRRGAGREPGFPASLDVLLTTWGTPATFPGPGPKTPKTPKTEDGYYGPLPGLLAAAGTSVGYLVNPMDWAHDITAIVDNTLAAHEPAVLTPECVEPGEMLRLAAAAHLAEPRPARPLEFDGLDLTPLALRAIYAEKLRLRSADNLQTYFAGPFLRRLGSTVARVVFPYENQPQEKSLRFGFRRSSPDTRLIGYVHAPFSRWWLSMFPDKRWIEAGDLPDGVAVPGEHWRSLLLAHGFPGERLLDWPAFRFPGPPAPPAPSAGGPADASGSAAGTGAPRILLGLPIDGRDALECLLICLPAMAACPDLRFTFKFHPATGGQADLLAQGLAGSGLDRLPDNATQSGEPLTGLLARHEVLLAAGSSIEFEAAMAGLATVFLLPETGLDMNVMDLPEHTAAVRGTGELLPLLRVLAGKRMGTPGSAWPMSKIRHHFAPLSAGPDPGLHWLDSLPAGPAGPDATPRRATGNRHE